MGDGRGDGIRWGAPVQRGLIRRLYETDARGIVDEELIDEVGFALLSRCEAIHRVTHRLCPHCGGQMESRRRREERLTCAGCGWRITWRRYKASYKGKRIHGGRAFPAFERFLEAFPAARAAREKMILIDALIHAVHQSAGDVWTVPAACNLIAGSKRDVVWLLDALAYGDESAPGAKARHDEWRAAIERSERATRRFYADRGKAVAPADGPLLAAWPREDDAPQEGRRPP